MHDDFHNQLNAERQVLGLPPLTRKQTRPVYNRLFPGDTYTDTSTARMWQWLGHCGITGEAATRVILATVTGTQQGGASFSAVGLPILNEQPTPGMCNQEQPMSCSAACARQILQDVGHSVLEATVRVHANTSVYQGTLTGQGHLAVALNQLDPRGSQVLWRGGVVLLGGSILPQLCLLGPWVADLTFADPSGNPLIHSILVDGVTGNAVSVRNPWGIQGPGQSASGTEGVMFVGDFLRRWSGIATYREQ